MSRFLPRIFRSDPIAADALADAFDGKPGDYSAETSRLLATSALLAPTQGMNRDRKAAMREQILAAAARTPQAPNYAEDGTLAAHTTTVRFGDGTTVTVANMEPLTPAAAQALAEQVRGACQLRR